MRYIMHPLEPTIFGQLWGIYDLQRGDWVVDHATHPRRRWTSYSSEQAAEQATRLHSR